MPIDDLPAPPPRPRETEHILAVDGGGFKCQHCGEVVQISLPVRVDTWCAFTRAFIEVHSDCPKPKKEAAT